MRQSIRHLLAAGAVCAFATSALLAQQQPRTNPTLPPNQNPRQQTQAPRQPAIQGQTGQAQPGAQQQTVLRPVQSRVSEADRAVASWLAIANNGEAQLGKLAAEHADNSKTKEFAQKMIEDHEQARDELMLYAPDALGPNFGVKDNGQAQQSTVAATGAEAAPALAGRGFNFIEAKRRIGEQCLQSARKEMADKKGADFDKCYIGTMIVKHQEMLDTQKALREYVTPDLQKMIDEQMQVTTSHLDHAKQLMRQFEKS
jgi:predicted outer membrane protein